MTATALKRLRRRLGLTQAELAARIGVAANTVARWERGELGLRPTSARLIEFVARDERRKQRRAQ